MILRLNVCLCLSVFVPAFVFFVPMPDLLTIAEIYCYV